MGWGGFGWKPYVPVAERRYQALKKMEQLRKKGRVITPVVLDGRTIARTFWGKAWCDNLESYSDFENRMPRGRTYVRNGSVLDLQFEPGKITALVSGSEIYSIEVKIAALDPKLWKSICADCAGGIDSLVELLQGRLSQAVMERISRQRTGLFPSPQEIKLACSCPDWADMCKHVAAVLYGVGARLDRAPALLFRLRQVDEKELIAQAGKTPTRAARSAAPSKVLGGENLPQLFGLDLAAEADASAASEPPGTSATSKKPSVKKSAAKSVANPTREPSSQPSTKKRSARTAAPASSAVSSGSAKSKVTQAGKKLAAQITEVKSAAAKRPKKKFPAVSNDKRNKLEHLAPTAKLRKTKPAADPTAAVSIKQRKASATQAAHSVQADQEKPVRRKSKTSNSSAVASSQPPAQSAKASKTSLVNTRHRGAIQQKSRSR